MTEAWFKQPFLSRELIAELSACYSPTLITSLTCIMSLIALEDLEEIVETDPIHHRSRKDNNDVIWRVINESMSPERIDTSLGNTNNNAG